MNIRIALGAVLIGICLIVMPSASATPRQISIGLVTDLTGRGAFFGVQSQRGAQLAVKELMSSGAPIRLVVEDAQGSPPNAVNAVIKLLESDRVDAVVCDLTPICTAIAPKVATAKKILIYNSPALSIANQGEYAYRNFLDYEQGCRQLASFWKTQNVERLGSLMPNLEFGEACLDGMRQVYPEHVAYRFDPGDDLKAGLLIFKNRKVQAVAIVGYESDFLNWLKISADQSYSHRLGFMQIMLSDVVTSELRDKGNTQTSIIKYGDLPPDFSSRLDSVSKFPGGEFNSQAAALTHNAVTALVRAIRECPSGDLKCIDLALRKPQKLMLDFEGWGAGRDVGYPLTVQDSST